MLSAAKLILAFLSGFLLLSLLLGLYRPVLVLWFLDRFNRLMVLKYYGKAFLISFLIWLVLEVFL